MITNLNGVNGMYAITLKNGQMLLEIFFQFELTLLGAVDKNMNKKGILFRDSHSNK